MSRTVGPDLQIMRKSLLFLSLLAPFALVLAHPGHNHEHDLNQDHIHQNDTHADHQHFHQLEEPGFTARDPHLDLILDEIKARSLDDEEIVISAEFLRSRIAGIKDHIKRGIEKRDLGVGFFTFSQ